MDKYTKGNLKRMDGCTKSLIHLRYLHLSQKVVDQKDEQYLADIKELLTDQFEYEEASNEERNKVRSDLEKYCSRDTEGMIWIMNKLKEVSYI